MTASDNNSYFGYLNKLVDKYSNTSCYSISKIPIDVDYSALREEIETRF